MTHKQKLTKKLLSFNFTVFLLFNFSWLNAGHSDTDTEEEEETRSIVVISSNCNLKIDSLQEIEDEYDIKIKNWAERIKPIKNPQTELARIFDLPDLKGRIVNKIGYFPFVWTYFPIQVSKAFPHLMQEIADEANTLNNPIAQFNIGWMSSINGGEIKQNLAMAFSYYQQAAENNVSLAQYICGGLYHQIGNTTEALAYMQKAAANNLAIAQYALGLFFINNNQADEGENWLRKSALAGSLSAQYALGRYLIYIKHHIEGNHWLEYANIQGFISKYDPISKLKSDALLQKWIEASINNDITGHTQHFSEL